MKLIYAADDDKNIRDILRARLTTNGYEVELFSNGQDLLDRFHQRPCDMIITDIMMPEMNGYDLCKQIRQKSMIPIFMISANNDEIDRVLGIELGSDDYISKPISFRELLGKMKNTFARLDAANTPDNKDIIIFKDLKLIKSYRQVYINDKALETSNKEFDLLLLFLENKNRAFSREMIIEKIWGCDYLGDSRQVDHVIKRLRKKMMMANAECKITTVWGYGYKIGDSNDK